ncbi:hypothetical protein [Actinocrinis sp.]|uniref:hypothetical protein n=1 Tax=Actinocrinis sp. TaxID=1920516 RepID=UPI002D5D46E1|nr:hypothetical protein [Actinocrinis sp.]HZP52469.1 hypothetical protein [Actinocrinis sp.]
MARVNAAAANGWGRSAALRLSLLALSAGAVAGAASACSAAPVSVASDPVAAVRNAAADAAKIHSAKVATSVTMSVGAASRQFTGLGEFDFDRQVGAIVLQTPQSPTPLDEIITPSTLYLRLSGGDAKWKMVDATKLPDGDLISAGYTSPVFDFALLRGVNSDAVHYVGEETVRDTKVTHYAGTLDLTESANQAQNPIKDELLAASHSFSDKSVPFDAYLDSAGRVRRVVAHFAFPAEAPQKGDVQIAATTDLFDLDQPVTVATPAAPDLAVTAPSPSATHKRS